MDARADLYALGIVLFECLTGQPPFTAIDVGELLHLHAVEPPSDVRELRPECSPGLSAVIAKLLAKDPDDRYQSAAGLEADLRRLRDAGSDGPFPLDATSTTMAAPHVQPPLVGRQVKLAQLVQRWRQAVDGAGGLALVDGPVGVGNA